MRATIDGQPYTVGLRWHPAESRADIAERREETGCDRGVVLTRERRIVGVGLAAGDDERDLPPAAAALLALSTGDAVIAVEWADPGSGPPRYWLAAVLHGAVVAGTDVLLEDAAAVSRELRDLGADVEYRITGAASAEFGGDGTAALTPARSKVLLGAAAVRILGSTASAGQIIALAVLAGAVLAAAWWTLEPDAPVPVATPFVDQEAERRAAAIAERHRALSDALSGYDVLALARWAVRAGRPLQRSAAFWRLARKRCTAGAGTCTLAWQASAAGATPAGLAAALGIGRADVGHDLLADTVTVDQPLGAAPERIEASEATVLAGRLPPLVDRCRRFQGRGGTCTLGEAQPPATPDAQRLPPELGYRIGRVALTGPLGRSEALLPLFSGTALAPWMRADTVEFDYENLEFHLEAHYVIP